jgi:glycosyltransferase involved in cell wall biosynthesis
MRVLQLIDTLEAGGAERVAVNFANGLANRIEGSFLCTTRKEGLLKSSLNTKVGFINLNRKKTVDFKALKQLKAFIKNNHIGIVHAHSTSIYTAVLVKLLGAKIKIVWHDHYGKSEFLEKRPLLGLKICSYFIDEVFSVNDKLVNWSKEKLGIKNSSYLPNFVSYSLQEKTTFLKGDSGFRIVCLANLRPQKDHITLIEAFDILQKKHPKYTLHLVGKDFKDDYSKSVHALIEKLNLKEKVFLYGSCEDTFHILEQAEIGVLSSKSEGLPLSLLEYGYMSIPVVCTNVGDCNKVIVHETNGLLIESQKPELLMENLNKLIFSSVFAKDLGHNLKKNITLNYSESSIISQVISSYKTLNHGF